MAKLNPKKTKKKKTSATAFGKRCQWTAASQREAGKEEEPARRMGNGQQCDDTGRGTKTTDPKSLTFLGSMQQQEQKGGSCRFVMINRYA